MCHAVLQCDFIASVLGLSKVGWVFTQAARDKPQDYIMSSSEVRHPHMHQPPCLSTPPCYPAISTFIFTLNDIQFLKLNDVKCL
jgi:hypothetical protein